MQQLAPRWPGFVIDGGALEDAAMFRVDGNYLYRLGSLLHPIADLNTRNSSWNDVFYSVFIAEGALEPFLQHAVFGVRTCLQQGMEFLRALRQLRAHIETVPSADRDHPAEAWRLFGIQEEAKKFEAVLAAELGIIDLYYITQKGTHRTHDLLNNAVAAFPDTLGQKAPEAVFDVSEACRCLAFEVPTACGFHLHRANEAVLRKYWDAVTNRAQRPKAQTMGAILGELKRRRKGSAKVKAVLAQIKDNHRNPVIHPEDALDMPQAMALMGVVIASITYMLEAIPPPPLPLSPSAPPASPP